MKGIDPILTAYLRKYSMTLGNSIIWGSTYLASYIRPLNKNDCLVLCNKVTFSRQFGKNDDEGKVNESRTTGP